MLRQQKNRTMLLISISSLFYFLTAYFLDRTNFNQLITQYLILFVIFWYLVTKEKNNFTLLVATAIVFRLVFIVAIPNLSQDFYRFIWDGRMSLEGLNPYLYLPETFINKGNLPIRNGYFKWKSFYQLSTY